MTANGSKSLAQIDLEAVVREVLMRLNVSNGAAAETPAPKREPGGLVLTTKVVSIEQLKGRLDGIKHLVVPRGAVITPAARDLLREKQIAVASAAGANGTSAQHRLVVGLAETNFEPAALLRVIAKSGTPIERVASSGLISVVDEVADQVGKSGYLGLVLTSKTASAVCLANRQRGVRAAAANDAKQVAAAVESVGANLLVVDAAERGFFELQKLLQEFVSGGPRVCPDELKGRL